MLIDVTLRRQNYVSAGEDMLCEDRKENELKAVWARTGRTWTA